jgi:hypothetical protein
MKLSRSRNSTKNQVKFINFYFILTTNIQQLNLKDSLNQKFMENYKLHLQIFPIQSGSFDEFIEKN